MRNIRAKEEKFTPSQIILLKKNINVRHVSDCSITYEPLFKVTAVKAYKEGKPPMDIFLEAGFDMQIIGSKQPKHCLKRWRKTYEAHGKAGLLEERRGKGSVGRNPSKEISTDEKLKRAEVRIKFLEAEVDFLKKLDALEKQAAQKTR
jgi:transposase